MRPTLLPFALLLLGPACRGIEYTLPDAINTGPVVAISRPQDQATALDTEALEFEGIVQDDNGLADIASVAWYSSLDGELGYDGEAVPDLAGRTRIATALSSGVHTITLKASDVAGLEDIATIAVIVDPTRVDPVAEITSPAPFTEFWIGDDIPLTGSVWDPNQPAGSLQVTWSVVNAAGGTPTQMIAGLPASDGTTATTFGSAPHGNWLIMLEVVDSDLHHADDALYIMVRDPDDVDADGDGWSPNQGDCDDTEDDIHPNALELCDNAIDDDCSGFVDDKDFDLDGHVDLACNLNDGPKAEDDCDDENATIFGGAPEATDGVDNDCDGRIDDGTAAFDADGDCWCIGPDPCTSSANPACIVIQPGDCDDTDPELEQDDDDNDTWTTCDGDCDDLVASKNLDDVDSDGYDTCDGDCDDAIPALNLDDDDLDGFTTCEGDCNDSVRFLNPVDGDLDGASTCAGDCNDTMPGLNIRDDDSDGTSTCEGDCDDDDPFLEVDDFDHDGFSSCGGDCDDNDPVRNPADVDMDGWSTCDGDCNDIVPWLNEDDVDNDSWSTCDGDCDDSLASMNLADADGDTWSTCEGDCRDNDAWWNLDDDDSDGSSTCAGDCNDASSALNQLDVDNDTWTTCEGDCNDSIAALNRNDADNDTWDTCEGDCNDANASLNKNDVDGDTWDTCEGDCNDASTAFNPGVADSPDGSFLDQNCDGIDGDPDNAVFVTVSGSGTSTCTRTSPCNLPRGLVVANTTTRKEVYMQAGTYVQVVDLPNNVKFWGGYNTAWVRASRSTSGHAVRIRGGWVAADEEYMTVRARSVTGRMADLILEGPDAAGQRVGTLDGRSSYVVHAMSSSLVFERMDFDQGNGAAGAASGSHGGNASQTAAPAGGAGGPAVEESWACNNADRGYPGGGGYNASCTSANGGGGGWGGTMDTDCSSWWPGDWDLNARSGTSGGYAASVPANPYGYPGGGGGRCAGGGGGWYGRTLDGNGGGGGNNDGRLLNTAFWYAFPGGAGSLGSHGTGGGGGGGSGGCDTGLDSWGAGGGGGGAGGCRAPSGGGGGGGGGGSFGVFGYNSTIEVYSSTFYKAAAGNGAKGGRMGAGQPGGAGGAGGWESPGGHSPFGGWGGRGGWGGHAGAGGGGAGGAVFGIYRYGGSVTTSSITYVGGSAGFGGAGGDQGVAVDPQGQAWGATGESGLSGNTGLCVGAGDC